MMLGFWLDAHLNPGSDVYTKGIRALNVYLHAMFPNHFPPIVRRLDAQVGG